MSSMLAHLACALKQHVIPLGVEDRLFEVNYQLDTKCEKCGTPLTIRRKENDMKYYYLSEKIFIPENTS